MAVEKFIRGKRDSAHHDGLYSNTKRLQQAEFEMADYLHTPQTEEVQPLLTPRTDEVVVFDSNRKRHQENLQRLHGYFYKGTYYHNGIGQPNKK